MIISWHTKKTESGFKAVIQGVGYQHCETIKEVEGFKTRARAVSAAKKWSAYYKAVLAA